MPARRRASDTHQLYRTAHALTRIPTFAGVHGVEYRGARDLPVMLWPDGTPCWPVNMFLMDEFKAGRSIRTNGGTIKTYAANLSPFVRFVYQQKLRFEELRDDHLHQFAQALQEERDRWNPAAKRRGGRQTNKIIRKALEFLMWYQPLFCPERVLVDRQGEGGQIRIEYKALIRNGRRITYIWHAAMVTEEVPREVKPLGRHIMQALMNAALNSAKMPYVVNRRLAMLKLLSDAGARRIEVNNVKSCDLDAAARNIQNGIPRISLTTAKRPGGVEERRLVPIPMATLKWLQNYDRMIRKPLVAKLIKMGVIKSDPGWLFLNARGEQLDPQTMTIELAMLRKKAGITERATLHMMRHRWITLQVLERLKQFVGKKLPMELARTILTEVASLTGHKSIDSLWCYIDFAFEEMGLWNTAQDALNLRFNAEAALRDLNEIRHRHPGWIGLSDHDKERITEILGDLIQSIPEDQAGQLPDS